MKVVELLASLQTANVSIGSSTCKIKGIINLSVGEEGQALDTLLDRKNTAGEVIYCDSFGYLFTNDILCKHNKLS